jgi:hypothetical protein
MFRAEYKHVSRRIRLGLFFYSGNGEGMFFFFFKTSVDFQRITRRYIPEDGTVRLCPVCVWFIIIYSTILVRFK